ncbi:MAG: hip [Hydrocarboniphaga sp.]|uniref:high-potential iron-sulfur protein n=1 Tax=Hydrocarboniphaga sp. TaxID=2033016 RepID=UPI002607B655|nr:high-potential iron-sulfur protein [Hydrocarboniphaga sp.]MDB5973047.1 hip [Hydrocarboniphaga sp.]
MNPVTDPFRRQLLGSAIAICLIPMAGIRSSTAFAADLPLVTADDATAKAVGYVDDASLAAKAKPGSRCGSCMLYQGAAGSSQGGCPLFSGKQVRATAWCTSWTAKS